MPEVDIEKKAGIPWWVWLLGALLLAAIIWWAIAEAREPEVATNPVGIEEPVVTTPEVVEPGTEGAMSAEGANSVTGTEGVVGEPITDILSIVDATDPTTVIGRQVRLEGAPVQMADATAFWVGPSVEQKMLVDPSEATMGEGLSTVQQRQRLNIEGEIREITNLDEAKTKWNLDESAITALTNKKYYLHANKIELDQS